MVSRSLTRSSQSVFVEDSICDRLTFALRVVETGLLIGATEKSPLLNKLDAFETILQKAEGYPADGSLAEANSA
jgi:hypothetical protein